MLLALHAAAAAAVHQVFDFFGADAVVVAGDRMLEAAGCHGESQGVLTGLLFSLVAFLMKKILSQYSREEMIKESCSNHAL